MGEREGVLISNVVFVGGVSSQVANKLSSCILHITNLALIFTQRTVFSQQVVDYVVVFVAVLNITTGGYG